jgi:hypothetical protein
MGLGLVDTYLAYKFIKMLATPWKKTDAYKLGIIDKKGKRIRSEKADDAVRSSGSKYTNIHKVIFNIKRLINKLPGGKTKLGGAAAAVWLLKEEAKKMGVEDDTLIEKVFVDYLIENDLMEEGINEDFNKLDLIIPKGTYRLNGKNITFYEDRESFDSVFEIPLFKINETVFSSYDIERTEDEVI